MWRKVSEEKTGLLNGTTATHYMIWGPYLLLHNTRTWWVNVPSGFPVSGRWYNGTTRYGGRKWTEYHCSSEDEMWEKVLELEAGQ